jgi:hypothetical protein
MMDRTHFHPIGHQIHLYYEEFIVNRGREGGRKGGRERREEREVT